MKRWALGIAAGAALLFALYAAAGYWLAPRLVLGALDERAAALGATLRVDDVKTDPFALAVDLAGVELTGPDGRRLAGAQSIHVDAVWASLWGEAWTVERAEVNAPVLELAFGEEGRSNWPSQTPRGNPPPEAGAPIVVDALEVNSGTLRILDRSRGEPVEVVLEGLGGLVRGLTTAAEGAGKYRLDARIADGGTLASQGTVSLDPLAAQGNLILGKVPLPKVWQVAAPGSEPAQGVASAQAMYRFLDGRFSLSKISLEAADFRYAGIELPKLSLSSPKIAVPPDGAIQVSGQADVAGGGSLSADGTVELAGGAASLQVHAEAVPLALAQRFLPQGVDVSIASGRASAKGKLDLDLPGVTYEGAVAVRDLRLEEQKTGHLLVAWPRAQTDRLRFASSPAALEMGEVRVESPQGRLIIEKDGSVNFARVFRTPGDEGEAGDRDHAPFRMALERLRIVKGQLEFADRSLDNPFAVEIVGLSGAVSGFSTAPGEAAEVRLNGRVQPYGTARIRGNIDLSSPTSLADMTASFKNLRMQAFNPYVAKFAGYRIASGTVSAELRYEVQDGRLVGDNSLVFEEMQLGEKVDTAGAMDIPLELAVALLADSKGRITLDIPVSGNLNDPTFDLGAIVAKAVGNVLRKIVTAPFRALAGIFGGKGGDDLGRIAFEPGRAILSPPAEEEVAQVAQALQERPRLGVRVSGGFDGEQDAEALRLRSVRREIAERAGGTRGPLDFGDPQVLQTAERLYMQRLGSRQELLALRQATPDYGPAIVQRLADALPPSGDAAETLARARAETVRASLIAHGVDPSRVSLEDPASRQAGEAGVLTELSLVADLPAQPREAQAAPSIRELQRKLAEAGFDPGPVDGILGPATRAALKRFQSARDLRPTGEPDEATLAALP